MRKRIGAVVGVLAAVAGLAPVIGAGSSAVAQAPAATGSVTLQVQAAVGAELLAPFNKLRVGADNVTPWNDTHVLAKNDALCGDGFGVKRVVTTAAEACTVRNAVGAVVATHPVVRTGPDAVHGYKWMINADNTGEAALDPERCFPKQARDVNQPKYARAGIAYDTANAEYGTLNPNHLPYPDLCKNPSVRAVQGTSPIMATGDFSELDATTPIALPNGRYLISVTAPGYKIDGVHFTVNGSNVTVNNHTIAGNTLVVGMNPMPLQTATVRVNVFYDGASANGQWDGEPETGLVDMSGFQAQLNDVLAVVTTDVFGNPLCTEYYKDGGKTPADFMNGGRIDYGAYDAAKFDIDDDGAPVAIPDTGGLLQGSHSRCVSGPDGQIAIPNMGPNRYAVTVSAPDPSAHPSDTRTGANGSSNVQQWIQTTTLEGGHDWDSWNLEGGTGYDTERIVANEATPPVDFGFVKITDELNHGANAPTGSIEGALAVARVYVPGVGGQANQAEWNGIAGTKLDRPISDGVVAISCLTTCGDLAADKTIYVQRTDVDRPGHFTVDNLPDGTYTVALWDESQSYLMALTQIEVKGGKRSDIGTFGLTGWFTEVTGSVFLDTNGNGRRDPGEEGVPGFSVIVKSRGNSLYDQGQTGSVTNEKGEYELSQIYPLGQFMILEAYNDRYKTTGITYKADNQPAPTTMITNQVDINVLPVIGLSGTLDWGVQPYSTNENGGIVGTVSYDSTRNEHNPKEAATEDYQPGIAGVTVNLYAAVKAGDIACTTGKSSPDGKFCAEADGSYVKGKKLDSVVSESWSRPTGCIARDVEGKPLLAQKALPLNAAGTGFDPNADCVESPMNGVQFGGEGTVDGNYGFGNLANGDYLIEVVSPTEGDNNPAAPASRASKPVYKVTSEESVNVFTGDTYVPQGSGYNLVGGAGDPTPALTRGSVREHKGTLAPTPTAECAGATHVVGDATHPIPADFAAVGGSLYEGQTRPACDVKHVQVVAGRSIAPNFHLYSDVPIPERFYGLTLNDLTISTDPRSVWFGEMAGIANQPIGIYDSFGRLTYEVDSDYNGNYEVLLPSTDTYNCPLPAGPCPNMYRLVANDPGQLGAPNTNYDPTYRTIATNFQAWPGVIHPVDQAPTADTTTVFSPGSQQRSVPQCSVNDPAFTTASTTQPEIYSVSDPIVTGAAAQSFTIYGNGFGTVAPVVTLTPLAGGPATTLTVGAWSATQATVAVAATVAGGAYTLKVQNGTSALASVNGLTIRVIRGAYNPVVIKVGVGLDNPPPFDRYDPSADQPDGGGARAVQRALDAAAASAGNGEKVVVVYPNTSARYAAFNPNRAYYENVVVHSGVQLQGVGPGGPGVPGSILDGSTFWGALPGQSVTPYPGDWTTFVDGLAPSLSPLPSAETVLVVPADGQTVAGASIDGFSIVGGLQDGFPGNKNQIGGLNNGLNAGIIETQGGGIFVAERTSNLRIANNVLDGNGGSYGGAIRIGTPSVNVDTLNKPSKHPNGDSNRNSGVQILNNRIVHNGGSFLAGAVAIFNGADNYVVDSNDFCGNFSTEYGGAISHYGLSNGGRISHNRIWFNSSYDEGGALFIGGELSADPATLTSGAGAVTIDANLIQDNLSNDDGGGLRFLMGAGKGDFNAQGVLGGNTVHNYPMVVTNNIIANNVATHEGGGVALDDTPNVAFVNNTVVRNLTTATAMTSDGLPAPAGLATGANSSLLAASLPASLPNRTWSQPTIVNSIFADNRAGTWTPTGITGIGKYATTTNPDIATWDMGARDASGTLTPINSIVPASTTADLKGGTTFSPSASNKTVGSITDVKFRAYWDTSVDAFQLRTNTNFRSASLIVVDQPITTMGNYHLGGTASGAGASPAVNGGTAAIGTAAPQLATATQTAVTGLIAHDVDLDPRVPLPVDIGGDEFTPPKADLAVTTSHDVVGNAGLGQIVHYTITVANSGPDNVTGATLIDTVPAQLSAANWTCVATAGATCPAGPVTGGITAANSAMNLPAGTTATFTLTATVSGTGSVTNTATVTNPIVDPNAGNNSATVTFTVTPPDIGVTMTATPASGTSVAPGQAITYRIVVTNAGPGNASAGLTDTFAAKLNPVSTTCTATAASTCPAGPISGNLTATNTAMTLLPGGSATFVATATVFTHQAGAIDNTATVALAAPLTDPAPANNTAKVSHTVNPVALPALPAPQPLDAFNRANANNLGASWSQVTVAGLAAIQLNANQASSTASLLNAAYWNGAGSTFGANQAAAFTFANAPVNNTSLRLKATGASSTVPTSFIDVQYQTGGGGRLVITTATGFSQTVNTGTFASGNTMTAVAWADGTVNVYRTAGATTTLVASVQLPNAAAWTTGGGRIGMALPAGARVDNFAGGTVAP